MSYTWAMTADVLAALRYLIEKHGTPNKFSLDDVRNAPVHRMCGRLAPIQVGRIGKFVVSRMSDLLTDDGRPYLAHYVASTPDEQGHFLVRSLKTTSPR